MQTNLLFNVQRSHTKQSPGIDIRAYEAHMFSIHGAKEAANSVACPPCDDENASNVLQPDREGSPSINTFDYPLDHLNVSENVTGPTISGVTASVFNRIQQTILQSETNDVEMEEDLSQKQPVPFISQEPPGSVITQLNNGNQCVAAAQQYHKVYNEDCSQQLLPKLESDLKFSSQVITALQEPVVNSAETPSCGAGFVARGLATQHILCDGSPDGNPSGSQVSSKDEMTRLSSCLEAMYCIDASSLSRDFATLCVQDAAGKPKKLSSKLSRKQSKKSSKNPTTGICKKGKQDKKLGIPKKKEFICEYDGCGKAFERRYNLKVHTRRHTGEMPYTCPKTEEGCFLYFRWRSSLRHHLKTVHNDVVPIAQNKARGSPTTIPAVPTPSDLSDNTPSVCSSAAASSSSYRIAGSSKLRVSKKGGIKKAAPKKQGKLRKNFPAVAVRMPTAEELAKAQMLPELKTGREEQILAKETTEATVAVNAKSNYVPPSMVVDSPSTLTITPSSFDDILDVSAFFVSDEEELTVTTGSQGASETEKAAAQIEDIFDVMESDVPSYLALPMLADLPDPEEFFQKYDN